MTVKAILFDFDGVIVDSVNIKTEAFRELFSDEKEHIQKIVDFHLANGGMSRFKKFEIIHRDILKKPFSGKQSKELGVQFSKLVEQKVKECSYMPGAFEFIQKYSRQIPLFVASGTPQDELQSITAQRGLTMYFKEIHGTPRSKPEIIRDILKRYDFNVAEMPFVGDSINDYKASVETRSPFYGYLLEGTGSFPPDINVIHSFQEMEVELFTK